jgi:two-component system response regulator HydG
VRELENAVERAVVLCRTDAIGAEDLPLPVASTPAPASDMPVVPGASIAQLERYAILKTLEHTGGSTSKAAEILGISARKIQYRLHDYVRTAA